MWAAKPYCTSVNTKSSASSSNSTQIHLFSVAEHGDEECPKQHLPQQTFLQDRTKEKREEDYEEKIDVEMLERDTPPDTPDEQIMDFSRKMEKEEDPEGRSIIPSPQPDHREPALALGHPYLSDHQPSLPAPHRGLPLHLHGLYGHREGLVSSYPLYSHSRHLHPPYQFLPPYGPHYPRLVLPPYSPPFPGIIPSRGSLRYSGYLGTDGVPYPTIAQPNLLPVSLPYAPSSQGGLKELTPNVSPPRGAPATPELSPPAKPESHHLTPEQSPSDCEEAMNLSLAMNKSGTSPRNGPGHKSLPYPLKKQNGKIKYECNICSKTFGQLSNLKVTTLHPQLGPQNTFAHNKLGIELTAVFPLIGSSPGAQRREALPVSLV